MATQETSLRKRQQITKANRMMFMWVAGTSAVVGIALVVSIFLLQKAWFNEKILSEKSNTASTLVKNNESADELKNQVRVLNTNQALRDAMLDSEDQPVQVVLDALPSDANSSALGASLQEKLLKGNGLTLEALSVDPVDGVESQDENIQDVGANTGVEGENTISFRFTVSAAASNPDALRDLLRRMERSIRPINITALGIETQGDRLVLEAEGFSYYEPAKTVNLKPKRVEP